MTSKFKDLYVNNCNVAIPTEECPPVEKLPEKRINWWDRKGEVWLDEKKNRWYTVISEYDNGKIIKSGVLSQAVVVLEQEKISQSGFEYILKHLSIPLPSKAIQDKIDKKTESFKLKTPPDTPAVFLVSVDSKDQIFSEEPEFDISNVEDAFSVEYKAEDLMDNLMELINKVKLFSKFQSLLFSFDKIKLVDVASGKPIYLSFIANRIEKFKKDFLNLIKENGYDLDEISIVRIHFKKIDNKFLMIKSLDIFKNKCCEEDTLKNGMESFLVKPYMKDHLTIEIISRMIYFVQESKKGRPWVDLIIETIPEIKLDSLMESPTFKHGCLGNFDPMLDAVLEDSLSTLEKLDYSFMSNTSKELSKSRETVPSILDTSAEQNSKVVESLSKSFKLIKLETSKLESFNPDDIFAMLSEAVEKLSLSGKDFEKILDFLSPDAFYELISGLINKLAKTIEIEDFQAICLEQVFKNFYPINFKNLPLEWPNYTDVFPPNIFGNLNNGIRDPADVNFSKSDFKFWTRILENINDIIAELPENENYSLPSDIPIPDWDKITIRDLKVVLAWISQNQRNFQGPTLSDENKKLLEDSDDDRALMDIDFALAKFYIFLYYVLIIALLPVILSASLLDLFGKFVIKTGDPLEKTSDFLEELENDTVDLGKKTKKTLERAFNDNTVEKILEVADRNVKNAILETTEAFKKLFSLMQGITIPKIPIPNKNEILSSFDFLKGFKSLRIPPIPELPKSNINFVETIKDFMNKAIEIAVRQLISAILKKIISTLKSDFLNDIANGVPEFSLGGFNSRDGLSDFVGQYLCGDGDNPGYYYPDTAVEMSKVLVDDSTVSNEAYAELATVLNNNSSIKNIIDAIVSESPDKNYLENITELISSEVPEMSSRFLDTEATQGFFKKANSFLTPETRADLIDFVQTFKNDPVINKSICLTPQEKNSLFTVKEQYLIEQGYDPNIVEKYLNDESDGARGQAVDLLDLMINDPVPQLSGLVQNAYKEIVNPPPACEPPNDIIKEEQQKMLATANLPLDKINLAYIEDLINDLSFPSTDPSGMLGKIMSDKEGRSMREVNFLKQNYITKTLIILGLIPSPEYAETVGKHFTSNPNIIGQYNNNPSGTKAIIEFESGTLFSSFLNFISKNEDVFILPKENIKYSYANANGDGIDVFYHDYKDSTLGYYISIDDDRYVYNDVKIDKQILQKYPEIEIIAADAKNRYQMLNVLGLSETQALNLYHTKGPIILENLGYNLAYYADINLNMPRTIKKGDYNSLAQTPFTMGNAQALATGGLQKLDPEIFGGSKLFPKFYINQKSSDKDGYYKDSFEIFDRKDSNKLNKTFLFLGDLSKYIQDEKPNISKECYAENMDPNYYKEKVFEKLITPEETASSEAAVIAYIRTHLSEVAMLSYNIFKNTSFKFDDAYYDYVSKRILQDADMIKDFPKFDIYNHFVFYLLLLESNTEMYMRKNNNDLSRQLVRLKQEYVSMTKSKIKAIKGGIIFKDMTEFEDYIVGFHAISFGTKYDNIYRANNLPIISQQLSDNEVRFANKLGFLARNIRLLQTVLKETIKEQCEVYNKKYPPKLRTRDEFLKLITSDTTLFEFDNSVNNDPNNFTQEYYKVIEKDNTVVEYNKTDLLAELATKNQFSNISDVFGNAEVQNNGYSGSIGLKYGLRIVIRGVVISEYEEDLPDLKINEIEEFLDSNEISKECFKDFLYNNKESRIFFDYCFQVDKVSTMSAIFAIENFQLSIGEHTSEQGGFTLSDVFPNPVELGIDFFKVKKIPNLIKTKKEIREYFLSNYIVEYFDPQKGLNVSLVDTKSLETKLENFDLRNLDLADYPGIFNDFMTLDNLPLDENGNPIVNSFLGSFLSVQ